MYFSLSIKTQFTQYENFRFHFQHNCENQYVVHKISRWTNHISCRARWNVWEYPHATLFYSRLWQAWTHRPNKKLHKILPPNSIFIHFHCKSNHSSHSTNLSDFISRIIATTNMSYTWHLHGPMTFHSACGDKYENIDMQNCSMVVGMTRPQSSHGKLHRLLRPNCIFIHNL
jgi:hypothetical protein